MDASSGSGAAYYYNNFGDDTSLDDVVTSSQQPYEMQEDEEQILMAAADSLASYTLPPGVTMSPKVPPGFDGRSSWMAYEELILDWEDITVLDNGKRGPALKSRLFGDAMQQYLSQCSIETSLKRTMA